MSEKKRKLDVTHAQYTERLKGVAANLPASLGHMNISDSRSYRIETEDVLKGTREILAHGADAMGPHERILIHRQKMAMISTATAYAAAVSFAVIAVSLILFAPESRVLAADIAAATLLVLAAGIGGFTRLSAKMPGSEIRADRKSN
jgi:hypothetical protein